jgi:hypothetical protein
MTATIVHQKPERRPGLTAEVAPAIAPGTGGFTSQVDLDAHQCLHAKICVDGKCYERSVDLAPAIAAVMAKFAQYHADLHAAEAAAHALPQLPPGFDRPPSVGAGCGAKTYSGVTQATLKTILDTLHKDGATITGQNPWDVVTHEHGVEFRGTWDATAQTLIVEVTDSDFIVPCSSIWDALDPMLQNLGARPRVSGELVSGEVVIGAVERVVSFAGNELIGAMLDQHVSVACAGWLDDIGSAIKSAGVGLYRGVTETVQKLKGPITQAAVAAASKYGGPAAGEAAAQLVGPVIDTAANLGKDTPQKAAAEQQAQTDPQVATALAVAKEAAAKTIAAYHVTETAKQAAAGEPAAQQKIAQVTQDAEQGDPVAKAVTPLVAHGFSHAIATRRPGSPESYQHHASRAVARADQRYRQQNGGAFPPVLGYVRTADRHQKTYFFKALEDAQSWYAALVPGQYSYAALFAAGNLGTPFAESFGGTTAVSGAWVSGFFDDVKNAVLTVTGTKATNQFIKDNHLEPYVKFAAQAVATYYGGPAAGAAAGAISPMVMNLGVEDKQKAAAAAQDVHGVKTMASQQHPQLAQAADIAHGAIDKTATTYHVAQIVRDAKAGVPEAQRALANLNAAAARGDAKAAQALQLAAMIDREQRKTPGPYVGAWYDIAGVVLGCDPVTVGGWHDIVGADDPQNPIMDPALRRDVYAFFQQPFIDKLIRQSFWWTYEAEPFLSAFREWQFGKSQFGQDRNAYFRAKLSWLQSEMSKHGFPSTQASVWHDVVGASPLDALRARAKELATAKAGNAAGVIHSRLDGHWHAFGFTSLDDAIDWLQRATHERAGFTYAAAFEKGSDGTAYFQQEEFSDPIRTPTSDQPIRRGVATTSGGW